MEDIYLDGYAGHGRGRPREHIYLDGNAGHGRGRPLPLFLETFNISTSLKVIAYLDRFLHFFLDRLGMS